MDYLHISPTAPLKTCKAVCIRLVEYDLVCYFGCYLSHHEGLELMQWILQCNTTSRILTGYLSVMLTCARSGTDGHATQSNRQRGRIRAEIDPPNTSDSYVTVLLPNVLESFSRGLIRDIPLYRISVLVYS